MIGISLPFKKLLSGDDPEFDLNILLPKLYNAGVRSIELRPGEIYDFSI